MSIKTFSQKLKDPAKTALKSMGYELTRINDQIQDNAAMLLGFDAFLDFWFANVDKDDFYFVQIGANDGRMQDPMFQLIKKHNLRGCLVEPQPDTFEDLKRNYADQKQLDFANVAVAAQSGTMTLYTYPNDMNFPEHDTNFSGFASFDRDAAASGFTRFGKYVGLGGKAEDYLIELPVRALTFNDLLKEQNIHKIDYLLIDAEGYDYEILKMIDFTTIKPRIIRFEHCCLSRKDRIAAAQLLENQGYNCYAEGLDTMGLLQ